MTTKKAKLIGDSAEELRKTAKKLRAGETDLDWDWDSDDRKEEFANLLDRVADLQDECSVQGSFSLGADMGDGTTTKIHRFSPTAVISSHELHFDKGTEDDDMENAHLTYAIDDITKQVTSQADACGVPADVLFCTMITAYYRSLKTEKERRNVTFHLLGECREIFNGIVVLSDEGEEEFTKFMGNGLFDILAKHSHKNEDDEDDDDDDDDDDDGEDNDPIKEVLEKHSTKIFELKGAEAKRIGDALLKALKGEESECRGGNYKHKSTKKD